MVYKKRSSKNVCSVAQSCPVVCNPMDCRPPGSSVHGDSPGKNNGVGCHALLQGIFLTQGLNPGLPHCRQIFQPLSHQGSPFQAVGNTLLQKVLAGMTQHRHCNRSSMDSDLPSPVTVSTEGILVVKDPRGAISIKVLFR